ncbi:hemocyte protein-glutamine gamma-glutamyltransferase-like [Ylistrum balloti]|uniref:hemocyte protein-glutamine gamma-glutamyltransferase-like n=1 Tax=Ylistrum balloti TaxID=509963 RepID=UPI002905F23B|nr:hemocyte protein-glutamine gamma-glutamyltransferase-like [Ylistrum balloti]
MHVHYYFLIFKHEEDNAEDEEVSREFHVESIDLKTIKNASDHHTIDYKCIKERTFEGKDEPAALVVRRGHVFSINITFDREYEAKIHDLQLRFTLGVDPSVLRGTEATILMDEEGKKFDNSGKWQARVTNKMPAKTLEIEVLTPPSCVVGDWDLHVYTISKDKRGETKKLHYKHDQDIFILFNAWCKEDPVYFPEDPDHLSDIKPVSEYVLNPSGCVYTGYQRAKPWRFAQFDEDILQISLRLIRKYFGGVVNQDMGNPIKVVRAISSVLNGNDNDGAIIGRWAKDYPGGTRPTVWKGSTSILRQFRDKGPVKYGQCWVFSAVAVTVARAVGIPCRSVTNYSSAHDADKTNAIEKLIGDDDEITSLRNDSIWNFHVWNEAWMTRPDLIKDKFNGWQIFDATPQETSEGLFQCGPAPLRAVREGLTYMPMDTGFVFAEVNADIIYYKHSLNGYKKIKTEKNHVGEYISTKPPDGKPIEYYRSRLDITDLYKHKEGSLEERTAVTRAMRHAGTELIEVDQEVTITIGKKKKDEVLVGEDLDVVIVVKNTKDDKEKRMKISHMRCKISSMDYTGATTIPVKILDKWDFFLNPDEEQKFEMKITWDDYKDKLMEESEFQVSTVVTVAKSRNSFPEFRIFSLRNDSIVEIHVKGGKTCKVGDIVKMKLTVKNPLPLKLTGCFLSFDTEKFDDYKEEKQNDIQPMSTWTKDIELKALRPGMGQILATLETEELPVIYGNEVIEIVE